MSFYNDYNQMYNLTIEVIQNTYNNIMLYTSYTNLQFDMMLYKNLVNYEPQIFEWCVYLLKLSIYYITFLCVFELISFILSSVSIYSIVTQRYIKKYNTLLEHSEYLCYEIEDKDEEICNLKKKNEELKKITKKYHIPGFQKNNKDIHLDQIGSNLVKQKNIRKAAKKANKTIKQLINQRTV